MGMGFHALAFERYFLLQVPFFKCRINQCMIQEPILKYLRRNQAQYGTPRASEAGHIALAANMD